jgi:predicted MPP superfamily phosphohydrolase
MEKPQSGMTRAARWAGRAAELTGWLSLAALAGVVYTSGVEPVWIERRCIVLALPRLAAPFSGYRLLQLSDLHLGDWLTRARLEAMVRLANAQRPDLVAITGDFVTRRPEACAADLAEVLAELRARDGVVAVLGNHDYWGNAGVVREALRAAGIRELPNTVYTLERGGALLHLAGVDDIWERRQRLDDVLTALPAAGAAVLLAHEPDFADVAAASGRFDLQLSGHSHGGQIALPLVGPPLLPPLGRRYPSGRYQVGGMVQYTNRGIGMVRPYVRFNCRPEMTIFTLLPAPPCDESRRLEPWDQATTHRKN